MAAASGVVLALSFPRVGISGLAWVGPALLLAASGNATGRQSFFLGWAAGLVYFLTSLNWLLHIPFPLGAISGWLSLSAYCALFPALWTWLCLPQPDHGVPPSTSPLNFLPATWAGRQAWILKCAVLWTGLEFLRAHFLTGFPWNLLGVSQQPILPVIQIAALVGVYGVTFLVVLFSVSLLCAGSAMIQNPGSPWNWTREMALPLLCVGGSIGYGIQALRVAPPPHEPLKVAVVQPDLPQELIWSRDDAVTRQRFDKVMNLTREALKHQPNLLVWPESAIPNLTRAHFLAIADLVREHQIWMIFGAEDAEPIPDSEQYRYFNASFLLSPQGELAGRYHKQHLVIFGEYVPLVEWLPFLQVFTPVTGGFTPGTTPRQFVARDPDFQTSVLICFEDVVPHLARRHVEPETDFLVNITNDGWFGESAAQWQQAGNAAFRAVENGLPLVRATNNGLSCWIDQFGGMHDVYFASSDNIYQAGFKVFEIPLAPSPRRPTFYQRHGDWFGWGCLAMTGLIFTQALFAAKRRLQKSIPGPGNEEPNGC